MRIAALVLLGAICLTRLPVDLLPRITLPTVAVRTSWPNVAPEEIEAQITRPLEQAVSSATNVYEVSSTSSEGSSFVRIQFNWGTDIGQAVVDVLQLIQRAQGRFPNDPTLQTPTVFKFDPSQMPILNFGVSGDQDTVKLRTLLVNQVSPILESANGVAAANVSGGEERAILVNVNPGRVRAHNLGMNEVIKRIAQENLNLPAGIARQSDTEYMIRSQGWFRSVEEISRIPLGSYNGQIVSLRDVATVSDAHPETRVYSRLRGKPCVAVSIVKQSEANTVATAEAVFERIKRVKALYPDLKFAVTYDQSRFISNAIEDVRNNAILGGVLAILVLMFFLRNLRSTLVVALSIPTSIVSTFALLYLCGFTLNTMSLGGLALATGLIVDDAVVVLENIFRHIERDRLSARAAAVSATGEIMSAVVASTWTVMIVFLPLLLIRGQSGQMFTQFALVVVFSLAVSLLDATTVVPMLASRLIQGEAHHENAARKGGSLLDRLFRWFGRLFDGLDAAYRNGLRWALGHRAWVIAAAATATGAAWLMLPQIGTEIMPEADTGDIRATIKLPPGTALAKTDRVVRQAERSAMENPSVETVLGVSGSSASFRGIGGGDTPYMGSLIVKLKEDRKEPTLDVVGDLRKQIGSMAGTRPLVSSVDIVSSLMTGGGANLEVDIFGDDMGALGRLGREALGRLREIPGFENPDLNWQEAMPEIQWRVDREKALQMGVTFQDIAGAIGTATNGSIASYYQEKGFQYPIIVQVPEADRKTIARLRDLPIKPSIGAGTRQITLAQVATPSIGMGPSQITRLNRRRYIAATGRTEGRSDGAVQADIERALANVRFPPGYYWEWGSQQRRRNEEYAGLGVAVFLAIALIYMLLASQYESFVHPLTVLCSVPLSAVGVTLALFLSGRAFGITAFVGLLMLVGIVVKNGILLVDYTNVLRTRGLSRNEAVLTAGPTRLRPILMTTSAAVLGMLPLALGIGKGSEIQAPMATAVIGGLLTSTFLTLFVIPTVYTLFDDGIETVKRRLRATR